VITRFRSTTIDYSSSVDGETPVRLCNYTDVYYNDEVTVDMPFMEATASHDQMRRFGLRAGDVLITKDSETADDIGVAAFVPETLDGVVCGYHLAILRPKPERVDPEYLFWSMCGRHMREQMSAFASGVTRFGLRFGDVGNLQLLVPDVATQRTVARFLDRETARIDKVISAKEGIAELLLQRSRTLAGAIARDDVGPAARLRHVTTLITSGPRDWSQHYAEEGVPFVRIANVAQHSIELDLSDLVRVSMPPRFVGSRTCIQAGDVLVSITAEIGFVGVAGEAVVGGHVSQHVALVRPDLRVVNPIWLALSLYAPAGQRQLDAGRYGGAKTQLSLEDVADVDIPVPKMSEQRSLVGEWMRIQAARDQLLARVSHQVRLLRERRQALITAAVTGWIDISDEAA
jgi:type I restriction enzyme S subunit